ncbi:MAG: hypothetical protein WBO19_19785, partial [Terriglobia bacterium]
RLVGCCVADAKSRGNRRHANKRHVCATRRGVGLAFYDPTGSPQATLGSGLSGVAVRRREPSGELGDFVGEGEDAPTLIFYGPNLKPQVMLTVARGQPHLRLFDEKGNLIHSAP